MFKKDESHEEKELEKLCMQVRKLINDGDFETSAELVCRAMMDYPDAPEPHNLFGIIMEKKGDHLLAMKHFRASWALDPTYCPADCNLRNFSCFNIKREYAFDESDCIKQ